MTGSAIERAKLWNDISEPVSLLSQTGCVTLKKSLNQEPLFPALQLGNSNTALKREGGLRVDPAVCGAWWHFINLTELAP